MQINIDDHYAVFNVYDDNPVINEKITESLHTNMTNKRTNVNCTFYKDKSLPFDEKNKSLSSKDKNNNEINVRCFFDDYRENIEKQSNITCTSADSVLYPEQVQDHNSSHDSGITKFFKKFISNFDTNANCSCFEEK